MICLLTDIMKILIITQYYPPEPITSMSNVAEQLVLRGHKVTVFTSFPNYPTGKLFAGYKQKFFFHETICGVKIIRVPVYPDKSKDILKRSRNYLSFALNLFITKILTKDRFDLIYVNNTPVTVGFVAILLGKIYRRKVVVNLQDIWPESLVATKVLRNKAILSLIDKLSLYVFKNAFQITVISPGFKRALIKKGIESKKIKVFYNSAHEGDFKLPKRDTALSRRLKLLNRFNVLYAGNLGPAQGVQNIILAAERLKHNRKIQFVLAGTGIEEQALKKLTKDRKLANIQFLGLQKMENMPSIYALCDAIMVHLTDDPLFDITIPGKTQSCLLSGRPIIASVSGDAKDLVVRARAGLAALPMNPESLSFAVQKLYKMPRSKREKMGQNGREFYLKFLSPQVQAPRYERLFKQIINS